MLTSLHPLSKLTFSSPRPPPNSTLWPFTCEEGERIQECPFFPFFSRAARSTRGQVVVAQKQCPKGKPGVEIGVFSASYLVNASLHLLHFLVTSAWRFSASGWEGCLKGFLSLPPNLGEMSAESLSVLFALTTWSGSREKLLKWSLPFSRCRWRG